MLPFVLLQLSFFSFLFEVTIFLECIFVMRPLQRFESFCRLILNSMEPTQSDLKVIKSIKKETVSFNVTCRLSVCHIVS